MRWLSALLLAAACTGAPPIATEADATRAHATVDELARGRTVLLQRCGGCHRVPSPHDHTAREWPGKLDEMSARAELHTDERMLLQRYLVAMAR